MLKQKRILVAEDNDWIVAELVQAIAEHDGIPLGPAAHGAEALALIDEAPDGAILDGNLLDGPITPVALALLDRCVPLVVFTSLGLPADLPKAHPNIRVIVKPAPCLSVVQALADRMNPARSGSSRESELP